MYGSQVACRQIDQSLWGSSCQIAIWIGPRGILASGTLIGRWSGLNAAVEFPAAPLLLHARDDVTHPCVGALQLPVAAAGDEPVVRLHHAAGASVLLVALLDVEPLEVVHELPFHECFQPSRQ